MVGELRYVTGPVGEPQPWVGRNPRKRRRHLVLHQLQP